MIIWPVVRMGQLVTCVMDGKSSLIIRCSIKQTSVKIKIVEKVHVQIIIRKSSDALLTRH